MQTYGQEAIISAGSNATGINGSLSFTVSQSIYTTNFSGSGSVSQGVQQPYEIQSLSREENFEIDMQITIFPNPTAELLNLHIKNYNLDSLHYQLFDLNGRLILSDRIYSETSSFSMQYFPSAIYVLKVLTNGNKLIKSFNIIKK